MTAVIGVLQFECRSSGPPLTRPTHDQRPAYGKASASVNPKSPSLMARVSECVLAAPVSEPSAPTTGSRAQTISGIVASGVGTIWTPRDTGGGRASWGGGAPTKASAGRASAVKVPTVCVPLAGHGPDW